MKETNNIKKCHQMTRPKNTTKKNSIQAYNQMVIQEESKTRQKYSI